MSTTSNGKLPAKYVRAERMLEELFEEDSRPSIRWVRTMTAKGEIPFVKIGGKILFDVNQVKQAIDGQPTATKTTKPSPQ